MIFAKPDQYNRCFLKWKYSLFIAYSCNPQDILKILSIYIFCASHSKNMKLRSCRKIGDYSYGKCKKNNVPPITIVARKRTCPYIKTYKCFVLFLWLWLRAIWYITLLFFYAVEVTFILPTIPKFRNLGTACAKDTTSK